jgi:hypothetical protein
MKTVSEILTGNILTSRKGLFNFFFQNKKYSKVLDLGCGNRLLNFATHGTDFSEKC